ncbi:hypothetical protein OIU85_008139 [Salix viminalis]|uniref:Uncharacterized protein n=1 Tax=Salix viminalis TaxID=40686 RepID=A0A9Q0NXD3_SALVM|nr:hypothetical protein OIU85_008139 [Salix viminalis]
MLPGGNMPAQGYILHHNSESVDMKASHCLIKSYTWCAAAAAIDSILENLEEGASARDPCHITPNQTTEMSLRLTITKENWQTSWDSKSFCFCKVWCKTSFTCVVLKI